MKERDDYQPLPVIYRVFHFAFDESVKAFQWREVANYPEKDSAEILRDRIRNEINARIDSDEGSEKEVVFLSSEPDISKGQETIHKWTLHKPLLPHRNLELSSKMREKDKAQFMEFSWGKLSNDRNYVIRSIVTDLMARELSETFIRWS